MPDPATPQQLVDALAELLKPGQALPSSAVVLDRLRDLLHPIELQQYQYTAAEAFAIEAHAFNPGDLIGTGTLPPGGVADPAQLKHHSFQREKGLPECVVKGSVSARLAYGKITAELIPSK